MNDVGSVRHTLALMIGINPQSMLTLTAHFLDRSLRTILLILRSTLDAVDALIRVELVNSILVALEIAADFCLPVTTIVLEVNYL